METPIFPTTRLSIISSNISKAITALDKAKIVGSSVVVPLVKSQIGKGNISDVKRKYVTVNSLKEIIKAISIPEIIQGLIKGKTILRKLCLQLAPRVHADSSSVRLTP